jgi:UDP-glucose 4-epimerase
MRVLVTGGAGYIGSHTCVELLESGHTVLVVDNFSNGNEEAINRIQEITKRDLDLAPIDIRDTSKLEQVLENFNPDVVIHFAGLKAVGESVANPLKYYDVNVVGSISLLKAMENGKCNKIVFSSSATVYGEPNYLPYDEMHPTNPVNAYGQTKLMVEKIIRDWTNVVDDRKGIILRYFNPIGAHSSGLIGEEPSGIPNNLMPYIAHVAVGKQNKLKIFGDNYFTKDGTGSRDYIHVVDLAKAHIKTIEKKLNSFEILNIGRGEGVTVMELLKTFEEVSGKAINFDIVNRRDGDLSEFWADASLASNLLDWEPNLTIHQMCEDTWRWQRKNPNGYTNN